jgi:hypothetical protein
MFPWPETFSTTSNSFFFAPTQSAEEGKRKKERVNTTDQYRAKKIEVMVVQISKRVQFGVGLFFEFR